MANTIDELLAEMRNNPKGVRFADAVQVAVHFFGEPRQKGTSHKVFKMPWPGDPRINLQDEKGKAKAYQVDSFSRPSKNWKALEPSRRIATMVDHYTYRVSWSSEDQEYVGLCTEFPSLSHLAADRGSALAGIEALVKDVVADMTASGEPIPVPIAEQAFSGKFQTRVPPELHRRLAFEAQEAGVSLNRLVTLKLTAPANDVRLQRQQMIAAE